ncbi:hypothetical protein LRN42_000129 [Shigella sonnei]|nr:hypothetical protein [Shigella sonnei]
MEIAHANIYGDGLTAYEETWTDDRIIWLNGFSVKTIEDVALGVAYTYPAETLEQLFQDIRNDLIEVEGVDGTIYGRVDVFGRDLRGDHPNIIRIGVYPYSTFPFVDGVYVIRPKLVGEENVYRNDRGLRVTEVRQIKGFILTIVADRSDAMDPYSLQKKAG